MSIKNSEPRHCQIDKKLSPLSNTLPIHVPHSSVSMPYVRDTPNNPSMHLKLAQIFGRVAPLFLKPVLCIYLETVCFIV